MKKFKMKKIKNYFDWFTDEEGEFCCAGDATDLCITGDKDTADIGELEDWAGEAVKNEDEANAGEFTDCMDETTYKRFDFDKSL